MAPPSFRIQAHRSIISENWLQAVLSRSAEKLKQMYLLPYPSSRQGVQSPSRLDPMTQRLKQKELLDLLTLPSELLSL